MEELIALLFCVLLVSSIPFSETVVRYVLSRILKIFKFNR